MPVFFLSKDFCVLGRKFVNLDASWTLWTLSLCKNLMRNFKNLLFLPHKIENFSRGRSPGPPRCLVGRKLEQLQANHCMLGSFYTAILWRDISHFSMQIFCQVSIARPHPRTWVQAATGVQNACLVSVVPLSSMTGPYPWWRHAAYQNTLPNHFRIKLHNEHSGVLVWRAAKHALVEAIGLLT